MAERMTRTDGVESGLTAALTSQPHDWAAVKALSDHEADRADAFGTVSNTMLGLIGFLVLAEVRVHLVAERRGRPRPAQRPRARGDRRALGLLFAALLVAAVLWFARRRSTGREWRATPARVPDRRPGT